MRPEHMKIMFDGLTDASKRVLTGPRAKLLSAAIIAVNADITAANPENPLHVLTPPSEKIFEAVRQCPIESARVVLFGQDPYIKRGEAQGMSFSVPADFTIPPSLRNIFKCMRYNKLIAEVPKTGDLTNWARQGVLLLNCALTTRVGKSNAHADAWSAYTDAVIKEISELPRQIIFILLGGFAQEKKQLIDARRHIIFEWGHPSNLNRINCDDANPKNFKYCNVFTRTNETLTLQGHLPINWNPTAPPPAMIPLGFREVDAPELGVATGSIVRYQSHTTVVSLDCMDDTAISVVPDGLLALTLPAVTANNSPVPTTAAANNPPADSTPIIGMTQQHAPYIMRDCDSDDPQCSSSSALWIFTDGGSKANGRADCKAAYGWYITNGEKIAYSTGLVPEFATGAVYKASNNRGELTAILSALDFIVAHVTAFDNTEIIVVSDSEYSIKAITLWIYTWEKDMVKHGDKKNLDLIQPAKKLVETLVREHKISFRHMNSHQDEPPDADTEAWFMWKCNDIVDKLCNKTLGRR